MEWQWSSRLESEYSLPFGEGERGMSYVLLALKAGSKWRDRRRRRRCQLEIVNES